MAAIYGPDMDGVLSGTFVYEWIQEANDYGIIQYPSNTLQDGLNVSIGSPVPMQPEFDNLQSQWSANIPTGVSVSAYSPSMTPGGACPATTAGVWEISGDQAIPDTPTKEDPTPVYGTTGMALLVWMGWLMVGATGTGSASASGGSAGSSTSASGKSLGAKTIGAGDNYGPWVAFLAACVALGCLV